MIFQQHLFDTFDCITDIDSSEYESLAQNVKIKRDEEKQFTACMII